MGKPSEERSPVNPFDSPYDQEIQPVTSQYAHSETSTLAGEDEWPKGGVTAKGDEMQSQDEYENPENPDLVYAQEILEEQLYCPTVKVGYRTLFKYASRKDIILVWISIFCAVLTGASVPMTNVVYGNISVQFKEFFQGHIDGDGLKATLTHNVMYYVFIAIAVFVTTLISTVGHIYTGEKITGRIRQQYLAACLRQNIAYYDTVGSGTITTRLTTDMNLIQEGISHKIGLTVTAVTTFFAAFAVAMIKSWRLTLILSCVIVAVVIVMGVSSKFRSKFNMMARETKGGISSIAEEVLSSIRTATAYGIQDRMASRVVVPLDMAAKLGFKSQLSFAFMISGFFVLTYLNYGLAFWKGSHLLLDGLLTLGDVLTVVLSITVGAFTLSAAAPNMQAFGNAVAAATDIFDLIERESPIDSSSEHGYVLDLHKGQVEIELRNITHIYPSRAEAVILSDVSLAFPAGKQTALVGPSGSGKSSIIGLIERFYNPVAGAIYLNGHDIATLNIHWLRKQIALVGQEPVLFDTTIYENIRFGLVGSEFESESEESQRKRIFDAARMANAHEFISNLPEGYETGVGDRGLLLSGGQKQRIAIARAVVSDPKILLLDEATSALDTKSEGVVQKALEAAASGRTTITIAHRLSTIKNSDNIVVLAKGVIVEQGTHDQLLDEEGVYASLVEAQQVSQLQDEIDEYAVNTKKEDQRLAYRLTLFMGGQDPTKFLGEQLFEGFLGQNPTMLDDMDVVIRPTVQEPPRKYTLWTLVRLIATFNAPEWKWVLFGLFWAITAGAGNPVHVVFFAKMVTTLTKYPYLADYSETASQSNFWSAMYLMLGIVQFMAFIGEGAAFAYCSEKLVQRCWERAFRTMLRQDIGFFENGDNSASTLTSFLSTETMFLAGLSGATLGTLITVLTTLIGAISLASAIGWKLALVATSLLPVLLGCGFLRFYILNNLDTRAQVAYESSAKFACEATAEIRTVASLTREPAILERYSNLVNSQIRNSIPEVIKGSILYGLSQALTFFCMTLGFWYGGSLIADREYSMFQFFICFPAIIFAAQTAGTIFSFIPDIGKAYSAAARLKGLIDRRPAIDSWSTYGEPISLKSVRGRIEFRNVHFSYPSRPEDRILKALNIDVKPGQFIALVGPSGCGKSTTISLLERFYDASGGGIYVDGRDITKLDIKQWRSCMALVSQESSLYQGSIRDNIMLGVERDDVTDEEIEKVCKDANIYDFVMSLPHGLSTDVGAKGTMLSGGQRQRICIARALLRNPRILLLDEATSALDSESEHMVQAALDKAASGRTTIAVAHRLSTIQNADMIYVLNHGRVAEKGTHAELMRHRGRYFELVRMQSLSQSQ